MSAVTDAGVPQDVRDDHERNAGREQQRRGRVPQGVQSDARKVGALRRGRQRSECSAGVDGGAQLRGEHMR